MGIAAGEESSPASTVALPPPSGVSVHQLEDGFMVKLSWAHDLGPLRLALRTLPALLFAAYRLTASDLLAADPKDMVVFALGLVLLLYLCVWPLLNSTTVLIGDNGLILSHGPLPLPLLGERVLKREPTLHLYVAEDDHKVYTRSGNSVVFANRTYSLAAVGRGGETVLTDRWHDPEMLRYVAALAERTMGIKDVHNAGQYRGAGRSSWMI